MNPLNKLSFFWEHTERIVQPPISCSSKSNYSVVKYTETNEVNHAGRYCNSHLSALDDITIDATSMHCFFHLLHGWCGIEKETHKI